jgi:hypothetical protein
LPAVAGSTTHVATAKQPSAAKLFGTHSSPNVLRVKLRDGESDAQFNAYAKKIGAKVVDVFTSNDTSLQNERSQAESRSRKSLTDLSQYKRLVLPKGKTVQNVIGSVNAIPDVQFSYSEALPAPAPSSANFTSQQVYDNVAPEGLNAGYLPKVPGALGGGTKIVDVEYSWDMSHEDLSKARAAGAYIPSSANPFDPFSYPNHGTAVLGELAADANSFGVTGLTPNASVGMVTTYDSYTGLDIANAVNVAHEHMSAGDVMLIEQQVDGPDGNYVPVEWDPATYDAIVSAVSDGIVVVEAGANGGENLDDPMYGTTFPSGKPDSGAIIVGAAGSGGQLASCPEPFTAARSRLSDSDYGSRVNLQGWGECVTTTGGNMGLTPKATLDHSYTNDFDGTSAAAPMIASAAAALEGASKSIYSQSLTPFEIRNILINTGTPQVFTSATQGQNIGPMPNLQIALRSLAYGSLFSDDFSSGNLSAWTSGTGVTIQSSKSDSTPYSAEAKSTGKAADKFKTISAQTDLYLSANIDVVSQSAKQPAILLSLLNANGARVAYVYRTQAGYLAIHNTPQNKSIVSTTKLPAGGWHNVMLHVHVGTSPLVDVYLDGTKVAALHSTLNTGTKAVTQLQIGDQSTGHTFDVYYDDVKASNWFIAP